MSPAQPSARCPEAARGLRGDRNFGSPRGGQDDLLVPQSLQGLRASQGPAAASACAQTGTGHTTPGPRAAQPHPDRGDLPASQHGGLGHEDRAAEQPAGASQGGPGTLVLAHMPRGGPGKPLGPGWLCHSAVSVESCSWAQTGGDGKAGGRLGDGHGSWGTCSAALTGAEASWGLSGHQA